MSWLRLGRTGRSDAPEWMDAPDLPSAEHRSALRDLERVNRLLRGSRPTLGFLESLLRRGAMLHGPVRILDVGSGGGDGLRAIARWAERRGISVELTGIDRSPVATEAAMAATPSELDIRFMTSDVFEYRPDLRPDLIVSSLFAHHLSDDEVVRFLRWMESHASVGWHVNDLHRHSLARIGFRALAGALGWHPIVRHDGAVSVDRGFTRGDWRRLLDRAEVRDTVRIRGWFPFRYSVDRVF